MHRRLGQKIVLMALLPLAGCASSPIRPLQWWRSRVIHPQVEHNSTRESEVSNIDSFSAAPPRLPEGIELPPSPERQSETQPSAATEPAQPEETPIMSSVIFAGFR